MSSENHEVLQSNRSTRNKELEQNLYNNYIKEIKEVHLYGRPIPLYLYSKRVYRAYHNVWWLIDRRLLTEEEINIMLQLGIYKPSQTKLGIRNLKGDEKKEMCKLRIGLS